MRIFSRIFQSSVGLQPTVATKLFGLKILFVHFMIMIKCFGMTRHNQDTMHVH